MKRKGNTMIKKCLLNLIVWIRLMHNVNYRILLRISLAIMDLWRLDLTVNTLTVGHLLICLMIKIMKNSL